MEIRSVTRAAALSCLVLLGSAAGWAQSKVAVINLQRAVLETASIQKASAELEAKFKPRQQEMEKLQTELQEIQRQLQTQAGQLTPQAQSELTNQGNRKQRDLQRLGEDLQADVERDRNSILSKASQQMQEVVTKLAEEKGLDVVIEETNTIFFKPALDITKDAIAAYDKAYPPK
ncbi:MAG: OmpH family outer membrane protein [Bryobacterales bacterium]|nr:OmpH family outer membrane protein [Bryobacterales bacterium]